MFAALIVILKKEFHLFGIECSITGSAVGDLRGSFQFVSFFCQPLLRLAQAIVFSVDEERLVGERGSRQFVSVFRHKKFHHGIRVFLNTEFKTGFFGMEKSDNRTTNKIFMVF